MSCNNNNTSMGAIRVMICVAFRNSFQELVGGHRDRTLNYDCLHHSMNIICSYSVIKFVLLLPR